MKKSDYIGSNTKINWYPGHMAKATREVKENLHKVNVVLEVRDARAPLASANPSLQKIIGSKKHIVVLNKSNLACPEKLKLWMDWFSSQDKPHLFLNSFDKLSLKKLRELIKQVALKDREKSTTMKTMIIGLPNTGKSTIINHLAGRNVAKAANKPGLTQAQKWVSLDRDIHLLDTPGIMPPNIPTDEQGYWLCSIHAIKDEIPGEENVAMFILDYLMNNDQQILKDCYKVDELLPTAFEVIEQIAKSRNHMRKGGILDLERSYRQVLQDFRSGKLGLHCFETPPKG